MTTIGPWWRIYLSAVMIALVIATFLALDLREPLSPAPADCIVGTVAVSGTMTSCARWSTMLDHWAWTLAYALVALAIGLSARWIFRGMAAPHNDHPPITFTRAED